MWGTIKTAVVALVILIAICALGIFIWSGRPVTVDRTTADPAMLYANAANSHLPPFTEGFIEHDGHVLHYVEAGAGEPVIFIHGFPSFWYSFIRQANDLRQDHQVILIDGLGVGRSDAPKSIEPYRLENMASHLTALLDNLEIERAHFVGHDWGAALAYGFAQAHPDRVASITGISSPPPNILLTLMETSPRQQQTSAYIERLKSANPTLLLALRVPNRIWKNPYLEHVENGLLSIEEALLFKRALSGPKRINAHINWYRANIPAFEDIDDADYWPTKQARINVPALLIWGNADRVFDPAFIDLLDAAAGQLSIVRYDDVGHWPHLERSSDTNAAIRQRISTAAPGTAD